MSLFTDLSLRVFACKLEVMISVESIMTNLQDIRLKDMHSKELAIHKQTDNTPACREELICDSQPGKISGPEILIFAVFPASYLSFLALGLTWYVFFSIYAVFVWLLHFTVSLVVNKKIFTHQFHKMNRRREERI
jgi:hypothetical protein